MSRTCHIAIKMILFPNAGDNLTCMIESEAENWIFEFFSTCCVAKWRSNGNTVILQSSLNEERLAEKRQIYCPPGEKWSNIFPCICV